jgi:hypothetical protein
MMDKDLEREMRIRVNIEKAGGDPEFTDKPLVSTPRTFADLECEVRTPEATAELIKSQVSTAKNYQNRLTPADKHDMIRRYLESCFRDDLDKIQAKEMGYRKPYDLAFRYKRLLDEIVRSYTLATLD